MNRLNNYNKYILKEGKFIRMSEEDQKSCFDRSRRSVGSIAEPKQDQSSKAHVDFLPQCHAKRQALCTEMSSSAIYPRKIEVVARHAVSRKVSGQSADEDQNKQADRTIQNLRLLENVAPRLQRLSLDAMHFETRSKNSEEINDEFEAVEGFRRTDRDLVQSKFVMPIVDEMQETSARKELAKKYSMGTHQQIIWLKRLLEDRQRDLDRVVYENDELKREMNFMKERVVSFQRANHALETQNAKMRMQLFSEEELIDLCCRQQGELHLPMPLQHRSNHFLEQEIERIKAQIEHLESEPKYCDTRSQALHLKNTHPYNERIQQLRKQLHEKKTIMEAHHLGLESKESLRRYITNIVEKSKADQRVIVKLRNEIGSKQQLIADMDNLISDLSAQLATTKKEMPLKNNELLVPTHKISKSMHSSGITSSTTILPQNTQRTSDLRLVNLKYTECRQEDDRQISNIAESEEEPKAVRRKLDWDIEQKPTLRKLKKDLEDKDRIIGQYEQALRSLLSNQKNQAEEAKERLNTSIPTEAIETDYTPIHQINGSYRLKQKKIGGESSKIKILCLKRQLD